MGDEIGRLVVGEATPNRQEAGDAVRAPVRKPVVIRLPKGADHSAYSQDELDDIVAQLSARADPDMGLQRNVDELVAATT